MKEADMEITTTMTDPSRTTRVVWLGLGGFFSLLTLRVLLWEVHSLEGITAEHLLTVGAIVGAIASGVYVWQMLRAGKLLTATGLAIAFVAATGYCLIWLGWPWRRDNLREECGGSSAPS